jgi:AhpD family alkylhydroperoxidase
MQAFAKPTFDLPLLARSLRSAVTHLPALARGLVRPSTSPALREKVMLGVTAVNDCRYCSWVHTGLALQNDVDLNELSHLLDAATFGEVQGRDAVAILFAKHFADTRREPSPEAQAALAREFTPREREEIMAYIHAIWFANLSGNSADAWLARLKGIEVAGGHPLAEAIAAVVAAPVLGAIALQSRRSSRAQLPSL